MRGVGPELARKFDALEIRTPLDLALDFPRDYKDWRNPAPIGEIVRRALARSGAGEAESSEEIAIGRVVRTSEFRGRIPIVSAELEDGSGHIKATWFGRRGFESPQ